MSLKAFYVPAVVAALVAADQLTKRMIEAVFILGESRPVIPGFFDLILIKNTGSAFGFLGQTGSAWVPRGFTAFTLIALVVIVMLYRSMSVQERIGRVALVMIGSGALGNLIDRVRNGAVTDFLLFYIGRYQWPAFNLADSLITVGVALLTYALVFHTQGTGKEPSGGSG